MAHVVLNDFLKEKTEEITDWEGKPAYDATIREIYNMQIIIDIDGTICTEERQFQPAYGYLLCRVLWKV